ncbi:MULTISPECIES: hypothetical protein [Bacillus cereus group]|uniref:Uncharacterized protein n=1 Tax=Bacillus thuringiensis TaxID=1428 RepID=A0A9X5RNA1_BACTU|nr:MULTISPECIES: hypothetical protein [Bacillus cereus group]MDR4442160.1 hypothetical protein [Bacillus cereus]OFC91918.1 hypothetical protein BTGOE4_36160 [Bacillus thuringiensis]
MEWLDKAANNAKEENEMTKKLKAKEKEMEEKYPDYLMQLWSEFNNVFDEIQEKFGTELATIRITDNQLTIKISDVTINAIAEKQGSMGGLAPVNLTYKAKNVSGGPALPYETLVLTLEGKWIYQERNPQQRLVSKEFGKEQIIEVFKVALWKYLK